jgi:phosphatidylserine/phosphatidylglycerophosphate/cardiolipin synthase-like enzyme
MKPKTFGLIIFTFIYFAFIESILPAPAWGQSGGVEASQPASVAVYFSPRGGVTEAVVKEINAAKTSILVQAYSFNSAPIAKALAAAQQRNVKVSVILDKAKTLEEKSSEADFLVRSGISTRLDGNHHTAHNKLMIIDGQVVVTGSFNFTKHSEEDNAENLLVIRDKALAEKYTANWNAHAEHSPIYEGGRKEAAPK